MWILTALQFVAMHSLPSPVMKLSIPLSIDFIRVLFPWNPPPVLSVTPCPYSLAFPRLGRVTVTSIDSGATNGMTSAGMSVSESPEIHSTLPFATNAIICRLCNCPRSDSKFWTVCRCICNALAWKIHTEEANQLARPFADKPREKGSHS